MDKFKTLTKRYGFFYEIWVKNPQLYLLVLPGIIFFLLFGYIPLIGLLIAFQDYNVIKGFFGSTFVGFRNFEFFFTSAAAFRVTFNTIFLNFLFIISGITVAMIIALSFNELRMRYFVKINQSIIVLPHFIAWPVVAMLIIPFIGTDGIINRILFSLGLEKVAFYRDASYWPALLVLVKLWKGAGWSSIVYFAVLAGINPELYESATVDGAGPLQKIWYISMPYLFNTAILITLFWIGNIFYGDFGMIWTLVGDNAMLYPTTDVIDTYVFRALRQLGELGLAGAVSFYQSIVGFFIVIGSNTLVRKLNPESAIF